MVCIVLSNAVVVFFFFISCTIIVVVVVVVIVIVIVSINSITVCTSFIIDAEYEEGRRSRNGKTRNRSTTNNHHRWR